MWRHVINMADEGNPTAAKYEWVAPRDGKPIPEIYANFVLSSWTMFDVRVRLGQLVPTGTVPSSDANKDFVVEERAAVTLSWQHAKLVAQLLTDLVASYEAANGKINPIKLPPDPTVKNPKATT